MASVGIARRRDAWVVSGVCDSQDNLGVESTVRSEGEHECLSFWRVVVVGWNEETGVARLRRKGSQPRSLGSALAPTANQSSPDAQPLPACFTCRNFWILSRACFASGPIIRLMCCLGVTAAGGRHLMIHTEAPNFDLERPFTEGYRAS